MTFRKGFLIARQKGKKDKFERSRVFTTLYVVQNSNLDYLQWAGTLGIVVHSNSEV
jgi:hypothetical protein